MTRTTDNLRADAGRGRPGDEAPAAADGSPADEVPAAADDAVLDAGTATSDTPRLDLPGVDPQLAARLRLVINRLARRLRTEASEGLGPSQLSALVSIELHEPITLGRLAERELVKPPSITRLVADLEERGLVMRETDAGDRRVSRLSLTAEGRRVLRRTRTRKTAYLVKRLRKLDAAQLALVCDALPVLERLLEDDR